MEHESWLKSRVKQTFPVLFISQAGLIKEFPVGWKQFQHALLITNKPNLLINPKLHPKKSNTTVLKKTLQSQKNHQPAKPTELPGFLSHLFLCNNLGIRKLLDFHMFLMVSCMTC